MLVAALTLSACNRAPKQPTTAAPQVSLTVTTATVHAEPVTRTILASGAIYPWQEVIIGPEVGGYRVSAVLVDVGDKVKRGQVLVKLSAEMLEAEVASKRAALRSAEAKALDAATALRRGMAISTSGALSAADLDKLRSDQVTSQAAVETAKADLATSELRLRYTQVTAPDDGTILSRVVTVGQVAQAGSELLRLLRNGRIEWRAEVPELQLPLLRANQPAHITGADGTVLSGLVRTVAPTVQSSNRTALVYVDVTTGSARPGMFARGEIETGKEDGNFAPLQSLVVQDGYTYMFVLGDDSKVQRRRVKSGTIKGDEVEIVEGARAGERVVAKGAGFLKDGDLVRVSNEPASAAQTP